MIAKKLLLNMDCHAKKRIFSIFLIFLLLPVFGVYAGGEEIKIKTVVIDPGHGGKDPGAIGPSKVYEKDVALDVSLKLGKLIEETFKDVKVVYTRDKDDFIGLKERAQVANNNSADLFISIHANSAVNKSASGTETFVLGLHRSAAALEVAKRENSSILMEEDYETNYKDFDPNDPDSYIALAMRTNANIDQSLIFANATQKYFTKELKRRDRGVKRAGFMVLYNTTMPSVLIELGFLSNVEEEKYLASEKGKDELAASIFKAFKDYKERVDNEGTLIAGDENKEEEIKEEKDEDVVKKEEIDKDKVIFKVQIATASKPVENKAEVFKGLDDVDEYTANGMYKYTVGRLATFSEAKELQQQMREKGYTTAFIVAFKSGERMDLQKALAEKGK